MPDPLAGPLEARRPPGGATARALGLTVLAGLIGLAIVGGAGLTRPDQTGWTVLIGWTVGLWGLWLFWRNARDEVSVPGHVLYPFLAGPIVLLLAHLLAGAGVDRAGGHVRLISGGDSRLLIRLMIFGLILLLAQDVFSRIRDLRWLLTGVGSAVAAGCVWQLRSGPAVGGAPAVAMVGFAGVGMLLAPSVLPPWPARSFCAHDPHWTDQAMLVARVALAGLFAALLIVSHPRAAAAGVLAAGAAGLALLLSAAFLARHRRSLLISGVVLAASSAVGLCRLSFDPPGMTGPITLLGTGTKAEFLARPELTGLRVLGASAGWVGLMCMVLGMLAALVRSLRACRGAAAGDQARAALWSVLVAVGGCALLCEGGLAVPAATVMAAMIWGLMPHVMLQRVRRFRGWPVAVVFAAALVVLGLQEGLHWPRWVRPAVKPGQESLHFLAAFVLTGVLSWQMRCRRWWQGAAAAVVAAGLLILGEPMQEYLSDRSFQWSDAAWNALGAGAALAAFLLVRFASWLENALAATSGIPAAKLRAYDPLAE